MEAPSEFVLPLFGETSWTYDEASLKIAPGDQFFDEQSRHDGLSSTRIICQKKSQWLTRQHRLIHRRNLVRERIDQRSVNGENRIKQMREANSMRLGHQSE